MKKTIIRTGASQGIGLATAKRFLEDNSDNKIILISRESEHFKNILEELKSQYKNEIFSIFADFSKTEDVKNAIKKTLEITNNLDVLVNNAGYTNAVSGETGSPTYNTLGTETRIAFFSKIFVGLMPLIPVKISTTKGAEVWLSGHYMADSYTDGYDLVPVTHGLEFYSREGNPIPNLVS